MIHDQWQFRLSQSPLIISLIVKNDEKIILKSLKNLMNIANVIFIFLENSFDESAKEIDSFIKKDNPKNIYIFDLSSQEVWPNLKNKNIDVINASNQFKSLIWTKKYISNGIWMCITPSDALDLNINSRIKIYESALNWKNPFLEFSNLLTSKNQKLFIPLLCLGGELFPGPLSSRTNPILYGKNENDIIIFKTEFNSVIN
jgi:hypothetical protein